MLDTSGTALVLPQLVAPARRHRHTAKVMRTRALVVVGYHRIDMHSIS